MRAQLEEDAELYYLTSGVVAQLGQVTPCAEDEFRNPQTGECQAYPWQPDPADPTADPCPEGSVFSHAIQSCVACPPGTVWDEGITSCQPLDPDAPLLPPGFVAPGAVDVRPANWDLDSEPYATYKLAWGDTYVGLSATYLGDGARWREIWDLNRAQHPNPDQIGVAQIVNMPDEARDKMRRWLRGKRKGLPGELPKAEPAAEKLKRAAPYLLVGAVAAAGIYYVAS
jgi:hypothetical protein